MYQEIKYYQKYFQQINKSTSKCITGWNLLKHLIHKIGIKNESVPVEKPMPFVNASLLGPKTQKWREKSFFFFLKHGLIGCQSFATMIVYTVCVYVCM